MTTDNLHDRFRLTGKRALVTGGSRGLGLAMARGLVDAGAEVAILSRTEATVTAAAAEIGAVGCAADVDGDPAELLDTVEARLGGPIDLVIHAAGVQHRAPAVDFPAEEWDRIIRVHLTSPFRLSQELGRRQLAAGRAGSHLFIGSLTSTLSVIDITAYTAAKSGIYGVVRNLSTEWSGKGIRANAIAPGYFRTELTEAVFADPQRAAAMLARIPAGRFGEPEELAGAAVFLLSDAASYVTGQLLTVDGGWTAA